MKDPQLRPASEEDFDFLYRLHRTTLQAYVDATWGWDAAFHRPVTLQVLKVNPARRLYERLGFAVVGETETHYQMKSGRE